ncbi:choice-of-anchor C family protein [Sandarakinorhabdus sp. DWP1-3-1]|uniref:choice-of-anchor C family protein n=1 Tax=Sandarakinorhabdus sp. DWP1-3-1 TaxID=2804627 RepID=UPI003CEF48C3
MKTFLSAILACCVATSASAVTITNGSFETGQEIAPGGFRTVATGNTFTIAGWTVGGAGVDYIGTYWQAAAGTRSVDLSGGGPGSVSQTIATEAGRDYKVYFSLSGNPDGGLGTKSAIVSVSDGIPANFTYPVGAANSRATMLWQRFSYRFTAFDTTSNLAFASGTSTAFGPAIDDVTIAAVPEPETWAMLLVGMVLVGVSSRRRQRTAAA